MQLDIMLAGSDIVKYSGRNPRRSDMKDYTVNEHEVTRVHLSEQGDSLVDGNVVELNPYSKCVKERLNRAQALAHLIKLRR